jgi:hypothetical protein
MDLRRILVERMSVAFGGFVFFFWPDDGTLPNAAGDALVCAFVAG